MEIPAGELVLLGDADDLLDTGQQLEHLVQRRGQRQTDHADDGALLAADQVRAEAEFLDAPDDGLDLLLAGVRLHDDDHWWLLGNVGCGVIPRRRCW